MTAQSVPSGALRIPADRVSTFRLSRQHLLARAPSAAIAQIAGDMAGAQAQVLSGAQISLWARTRGLGLEDVQRALLRDRTLVKVWCMRSALHLIPSDDYAVFVHGSARRKWIRWTGWLARVGIPAVSTARLVEAVRDALDAPRTRNEIAERLSGSLGLRATRTAGRGWGGPSDALGFKIGRGVLSVNAIVFLACARGIACFGPPRGNEATFVRPEEWLPGWRKLDPEAAEEELLRRYLAVHGPATIADFTIWNFLTVADAKAIWARLGTDLAPVHADGGTAWVLRRDLPAFEQAATESLPVRLLPYFDSFLLGLRDKGHLVDAAHHGRVYRPAGWLSPVVLVDGRAGGVWSHERKGARLAVRVEPFRPFPASVRTAVRGEAEDLARFFGCPEVSVTFAGARKVRPVAPRALKRPGPRGRRT